MADIKSLSTAHQINLVINKLTKATLDELSSSGKLSSELSNQLFMTTDESEGGGGGSADIVYMTQDEYDKAVKDESKYYATPGSGGSGGGSKVQLSCVATGGNTVAVISVDSVPYTLKSGPVPKISQLAEEQTTFDPAMYVAVNGSAATNNKKMSLGLIPTGGGSSIVTATQMPDYNGSKIVSVTNGWTAPSNGWIIGKWLDPDPAEITTAGIIVSINDQVVLNLWYNAETPMQDNQMGMVPISNGDTVKLTGNGTNWNKQYGVYFYPAKSVETSVSLKLNSKTQDGIVAKGDGNANKVWATDGSGNPGWTDASSAPVVWEDIYVSSTHAESGLSFGYTTLSKKFTNYKMLMIEAYWTSSGTTYRGSKMISVNVLNSTSGGALSTTDMMHFSLGDNSIAEWWWKPTDGDGLKIYRGAVSGTGIGDIYLTVTHIYGIK